MVLLRMRHAGAPHRGEGDSSRPRPAAALRGILCRREGPHLQEVRRAPSRQEAASGLGEDSAITLQARSKIPVRAFPERRAGVARFLRDLIDIEMRELAAALEDAAV